MSRRGWPGNAALVCVVFGFVWSGMAAAEAPREPIGPAVSAPAWYFPDSRAVIVDEGFETAVPPPGWIVVATHPPNDTWYQFDGAPHSGAFSAAVVWDDQLQQDEWLLTPQIVLESGTLSFWSNGSPTWCRDGASDACDLEVWLIIGCAGDGDDILIGIADSDWAGEFVWSQSVFVLDSYLPLQARIGFRYSGLDGAAVGLDDVVLDGDLVVLDPIFLNGFETGDTTAWSVTVE